MGQDDESPPFLKDSAPGINIEDLSLPKSIVIRLAKAALPANTQIQSNAMLGLTKSATLFINYIASQANEIAAASNRKTVNANDVFAALEDSEFASWKSRLEAELQKNTIFVESTIIKIYRFPEHTEIIEQRREKVKSKEICGAPAAKKIKRVKVNPDENANSHENDPVQSEPSDNKSNGVKSSTNTKKDDSEKEDEEKKNESEKGVEDEEDNDDDDDDDEEDEGEEEGEEEVLAIEEIGEEEEANNSDEALDNGEDSD
ncbi:putative h2a domain containing protein [Erysiphe neolycopersici]|uniref:DNA polymerase epsilon subunit D n=1 Tax=Erysiphe neolycopersici TaxID=212602 RepID=A0A420HTU4_9PEZI|nr:putative h2a domain containing protein [Erysiphe neolycopersici]